MNKNKTLDLQKTNMSKNMISKLCGYVGCALSIVLIILWCCNTGGFSVVNLDSFVGVIVALLAILITVVLGWQIYNAIEMKQKIHELEILKNQFAEQKETVEQLANKTRHCILLTWGDDAADNDENEESFRYYIAALKFSMMLKNPLNIDVIQRQLNTVANRIKKGASHQKEFYQEVLNDNRIIRNMPNYVYIKTWYEPLLDIYISNVNKNKTT